MSADKFRFRFGKTGLLRLLSHHDLMRSLERMLRRAGLPFKSTAGFHPAPRVVFALSLPLGVEGLDEVLEIEFTRALDLDDVLNQLREQAPAGLTFLRASAVPMKATAIPRRVVYRTTLPADRADETAQRCRELLAHEKLWVNRLKPSPKRLNIRPYFRDLRVTPAEHPTPGHTHTLTLDLWVTQTGTARADELIDLLGLEEFVEAGAVVERALVEVRDEVPNTDPADVPPDGPAETLPLDPGVAAAMTRKLEDQATATAACGVTPAGPVVE
jgi:radical SAM-linked protein